MFIVQIWRPEACDAYMSYGKDYFAVPFDGVEILGFCETEDEVNALIDAYENGARRFHYEELSDDCMDALRGSKRAEWERNTDSPF